MIRPTAAERRARKHERYLREIRDRYTLKVSAMIAETIGPQFYSSDFYDADWSSKDEYDQFTIQLARAVTDKLRAEGVVR